MDCLDLTIANIDEGICPICGSCMELEEAVAIFVSKESYCLGHVVCIAQKRQELGI